MKTKQAALRRGSAVGLVSASWTPPLVCGQRYPDLTQTKRHRLIFARAYSRLLSDATVLARNFDQNTWSSVLSAHKSIVSFFIRMRFYLDFKTLVRILRSSGTMVSHINENDTGNKCFYIMNSIWHLLPLFQITCNYQIGLS